LTRCVVLSGNGKLFSAGLDSKKKNILFSLIFSCIINCFSFFFCWKVSESLLDEGEEGDAARKSFALRRKILVRKKKRKRKGKKNFF